MKKLLEKTICMISIISMLWMMVSYVEILCKHNGPNPTYSEANIIVKLVEEANNND